MSFHVKEGLPILINVSVFAKFSVFTETVHPRLTQYNIGTFINVPDPDRFVVDTQSPTLRAL